MKDRKIFISRKGLIYDDCVQTFGWEKGIQTLFALSVLEKHERILNVGLGLGFAQSALRTGATEVAGIEKSPIILRSYLRNYGRAENETFIVDDWRTVLSSNAVRSYDAIYFDAVSVNKNFDYQFTSYFRDFTELARVLGNVGYRATLYALAFHPRPIYSKRSIAEGFRPFKWRQLPIRIPNLPPLVAVLYKRKFD